jgi:hypothetical protein
MCYRIVLEDENREDINRTIEAGLYGLKAKAEMRVSTHIKDRVPLRGVPNQR